jgi:hypothetical protein
MTYRGHLKHGVIILDPPVLLPEGTPVEVRPSQTEPADATWGSSNPDKDDAALTSGSVAAITASLPPEDFSDWEK